MFFSASLGLVLVLALGSLGAQGAPPAPTDSGFQLRVLGDVAIGRDQREGAALVIKGNARVEGTVRALVVIEGTATLAGGHVGDLTVVSGRAELTDSAVVEHEVHLLDAEISIAEGARVVGTIERGAGRRLARDLVGLAALVGLGILIALVVGGVIGAAIAPHAIRSAGRLIGAETGKAAIAALLVWVALPFAALLLIATVIGVPAGIGVFLFVLPTLWYLGLIVAGTWLGDLALGRARGRIEATRPYVAASTGIAGLLILSHLPLVGALTFVAVALGSGAVALACWRAATTTPVAHPA